MTQVTILRQSQENATIAYNVARTTMHNWQQTGSRKCFCFLIDFTWQCQQWEVQNNYRNKRTQQHNDQPIGMDHHTLTGTIQCQTNIRSMPCSQWQLFSQGAIPTGRSSSLGKKDGKSKFEPNKCRVQPLTSSPNKIGVPIDSNQVWKCNAMTY